MILVDTSVWIEIFKDKTGHVATARGLPVHTILSRNYQTYLAGGRTDLF